MNTIQFNEIGLSDTIMRALNKMQFSEATPVQAKTIVPMMKQQDLVVQAPTGTGKTGAFGIPMVEMVDPKSRRIQSVVLCPTRELAVQITNVLKQLTQYKPGVRILALYGGEPIQRQIMALKRGAQIIVATPGRMMDHINRRTARLDKVGLVVLDEADRMLDMGFRDDINTILQSVPDDRQTVLFSATISNEIQKIAANYQQDAQQIQIKQETLTVTCVEQFYGEVRGKSKTFALVSLLGEKQFSMSIVFVATKAMAETLSQQLDEKGFRALALHGDMRQRQRDIVMRKYRQGEVDILVATDVAARGIDVQNVDAVINYDIPQDSESYVHRIGRTGRANKTGSAYTFIYPKERGKLQNIMNSTKAVIQPVKLANEKNSDIVDQPMHPKRNHYNDKDNQHKNRHFSGKDSEHRNRPYGSKDAGQKRKQFKDPEQRNRPFGDKDAGQKRKQFSGKDSEQRSGPHGDKDAGQKKKQFSNKDGERKSNAFGGKDTELKQKPYKNKDTGWKGKPQNAKHRQDKSKKVYASA